MLMEKRGLWGLGLRAFASCSLGSSQDISGLRPGMFPDSLAMVHDTSDKQAYFFVALMEEDETNTLQEAITQARRRNVL